jgi:hypothetical protein
MAEHTNAQLVEFANADCRQIADEFTRLVTRTAAAKATYLARDLATPIEAVGAGNLIADGSQSDGRTRCTGGDIYNLVTLLTDFQTFMTQGRKDVVAKWKVNGDR